jgi:hypothetical protein
MKSTVTKIPNLAVCQPNFYNVRSIEDFTEP